MEAAAAQLDVSPREESSRVPELSTDPRRRAAQERCLHDIATHGTHVIRVFGDDEWPEFAYTIGLFENFGHPELIMLGMPGERAHGFLNSARDDIRGGSRFAVGDEVDGILEGVPVAFRSVPAAHRTAHFGLAEWFYGEREFPCLQMVYPSRLGPWPWDPEASDDFKRVQPLLESTPLPEWALRAPV